MAKHQFGALNNAEQAVQRFLYDWVDPVVLRRTSPATININLAFSGFLRQYGLEELVAAEVAEQQGLLVRRRLKEYIDRWGGQGVLAPLNFTVESEEVVVSWSHAQFAALTGGDPPDTTFVDVYEWLGAQAGREFLLPCVCFLKILGCDPIFITDGPRDEGIDCIGLVAEGGLRSTAIFIQARAKSDWISSDELLQEYAKYAALPRARKYMEYLEALGIPVRQDGAGFLYTVLTNSDFKYAAQVNAARLGVLLRSRRQLAQMLSRRTDAQTLTRLKEHFAIPTPSDLRTNLAPLLTF